MCWSVFSDFQYSNPVENNKYDEKAGRNIIIKQFYSIDVEDIETHSRGEVQEGIIVAVKNYSLSENLYRFWNQLSLQNTAEGKLFDSIETQIYGNKKCSSDTSKKVFGYFGVSAVRNYNLYMIPYDKDSLYVEKSDINIDITGPGYVKNEVPYFWHGKNGKIFINQ